MDCDGRAESAMSESNPEIIVVPGRRWTILAAGVLLAALAVVVDG